MFKNICHVTCTLQQHLTFRQTVRNIFKKPENLQGNNHPTADHRSLPVTHTVFFSSRALSKIKVSFKINVLTGSRDARVRARAGNLGSPTKHPAASGVCIKNRCQVYSSSVSGQEALGSASLHNRPLTIPSIHDCFQSFTRPLVLEAITVSSPAPVGISIGRRALMIGTKTRGRQSVGRHKQCDGVTNPPELKPFIL